ncbi:MAG: hypothetical protein LBJ69_02835 [Holosporales bacterium]|nr:hypothetical protein [Holosporales bacterium]
MLAMCIVAGAAYSIKIEVTGGSVGPEPIMILHTGDNEQGGHEVVAIILNDLVQSGLFVDVGSQCKVCKADLAKLSKQSAVSGNPHLMQLKQDGARYLALVRVTGIMKTIKATLIDVTTGKILLDSVGTELKDREAAHDIADKIYKRITNEDGYFNTQIVYVETVPGVATSMRRTKVVVIDQDGDRRKEVTDGLALSLTPRYGWTDRHTIVYVLIDDRERTPAMRVAQAYTLNLKMKSRKRLIGDRMLAALQSKNQGAPVQMSYAPRLSPDGRSAVLAVAIRGTSAIYAIDIGGDKITQITQHGCIDTSPSFSNDGKFIVFTSNRHGTEAIYRARPDGSDVVRLSGGEGKYSQPAWSPRGDLIAFTKQHKGTFFIGVMKTDGTGERLIASGGYVVEAPSWVANGRYVVYTEAMRGGKSRIVMIDITGRHKRYIDTYGDASSPSCSPPFTGA